MDKLIIVLSGLIIVLSGLALVLGMVLLISGLLALLVQALWNGCLVGAINGVNEITFLQAWGLSLLSHMLFKQTVTQSKK